jgi:hypothetical protein
MAAVAARLVQLVGSSTVLLASARCQLSKVMKMLYLRNYDRKRAARSPTCSPVSAGWFGFADALW